MFFSAPESKPPLWANLKETDSKTLSWIWATIAALCIVGIGTYGVVHIATSHPPKPIEKQVMKVVMVNLSPEPKIDEPKKETPPEPLKPKIQPKEIKKVVTTTPQPKLEPQPQAIAEPVAVESPVPASGADTAINISPALSSPPPQPSPPKNFGGAIEVRRGVASLVDCQPEYPSRALQNGITGEFVVHMTVEPSGMVSNVKVISGSPREMFERDIKRSMSKCKFAPTDTGFVAEAPLVFKLE